MNYTGTTLVDSDYLDISYSIGTPSNRWYAGSNSTDSGNNTGWIFTPGGYKINIGTEKVIRMYVGSTLVTTGYVGSTSIKY